MGNIKSVKEAAQKAKELKTKGKKIILAGGCFDILHVGHLKFLQQAKKLGGVLFILLESDKKIKILKGKNRPINSLKERALLLSSLSPIDFVILLPFMHENQQYDKIVNLINPDIIAISEDDSGLMHKKRQAENLGIKIKVVTKKIKNRSTTRVSSLVLKEKEL
ncbi:adenylyltransferase/cytidyltransferase family protein [Patescibacteria group bacterium]|nr:adenylyltransferase/cytidyltransferase family protein [Patescibacteria group bacterium]